MARKSPVPVLCIYVSSLNKVYQSINSKHGSGDLHKLQFIELSILCPATWKMTVLHFTEYLITSMGLSLLSIYPSCYNSNCTTDAVFSMEYRVCNVTCTFHGKGLEC